MASSIITATLWSVLQRGGTLAISFISNIVLARLLSPEDYGLIAMVLVFVGIADVLVDGGLGNALIQKKELDKRDLETVFSANMTISVLFYVLLFIIAPYIARYTGIFEFTICLRVLAISTIIKSLYVVNFSLLNREFAFRRLASINLIGYSLSTIVAIILAFFGFGVWALIIRTLFQDVVLLICYCYSKGFTSIGFNKKSFNSLFGFGIFVATTNLITSLYGSVISFFIGKKYSVQELGYYNQACTLHQVPVFSISAVVNQVFFPYFSLLQGDISTLRSQFYRTIAVVTFCVYPLLAFLFLFGEPVINLLYSEKWLPCVPLFQILCFSGFFNTLLHLSNSTLKAIGHTKEMLYAHIIYLIIGIIVTAIGLNFSIYYFVVLTVSNNFIIYILTGSLVGRYIGLNIVKQFAVLLPNLLLSMIAAYVAKLCILQLPHLCEFLEIILAIILTFVIYALLQYVFKTRGYTEVYNKLFKNNNK